MTVYWPVGNFPFVSIDDPRYVVRNTHVRGGWSWEGVKWAFRSLEVANWHPLTWLSHMTDVEWFGMEAGWHHRVNLLLHIGNVVLLFLLLHGMTGALWRSAFVAALFGLHPLHVESVAWVAERKDVLCTLFGFAAIWAYSRYAMRPDWRGYSMAVFLFAVGLLAKPMLVTLPFLLLLLDFWPLRRFPPTPGDGNGRRIRASRLIAEKIPFVLLSAGSCVMTLVAQSAGGTVSGTDLLSPAIRLGNAFASYALYLGKTFWPVGLAVFYPHPASYHDSVGLAGVAAGILAVGGLSVLAAIGRKGRPYLLVGWSWFLITLVPVIGFVQVGWQAMADRYTYIPLVGIFIAVTWGLCEALEGFRPREAVLGTAGLLALLALAVACRVQVSRWRGDESLFRHAVSVTSNNWLAHNNLGNALFLEGRLEEAAGHFREALRILPGYPEAAYNLANCLLEQGRNDEAVEMYRDLLKNRPFDPDVRNNLGISLFRRGDAEEAIAEFREAVRLNPGFDAARRNMEIVSRAKAGR